MMGQVNFIGMALYLLLSVVGGTLAGIFTAYQYVLIKKEFGRLAAIAVNGVFFIIPLWAIFGLLKQDDLMVFYLILIVAYLNGIRLASHSRAGSSRHDKGYGPADDD